MSLEIIKINDLAFEYVKNRKVLKDVSFKVNKGEKVGIIGPNGAGKSTLLRILTGLECEYNGSVEIADLIVSKKNLKNLRKNIGYVFQDSDAQMFLTTVKDNVAFGPANYGYTGEELDTVVNEALKEVGIEKLIDSPIYMLSGGEKKLASIATVLAVKPEVLLFDEPSGALDSKNRRRLINVINSLNKTLLVTSHDLDFIYDTCDRVLLLGNNTIVKDSKKEDILTDKNLLEEYGLELPLSFVSR
ncbi:MAG: ABC transporter ATP-binding protein [Lachnospiraceae bacterium]|nr:ABC transporter ATP-binding protein [Lachnospiraceae bacterium]